ncbi:hypothetical protein [Nonomuraea sp. NPDC049504]|uniref:hypothetical protein n=1 Tax=Nonomuraea sp. NPDC049504 TaxID=3154729 RepID=UPI00341F2B09
MEGGGLGQRGFPGQAEPVGGVVDGFQASVEAGVEAGVEPAGVRFRDDDGGVLLFAWSIRIVFALWRLSQRKPCGSQSLGAADGAADGVWVQLRPPHAAMVEGLSVAPQVLLYAAQCPLFIL